MDAFNKENASRKVLKNARIGHWKISLRFRWMDGCVQQM